MKKGEDELAIEWLKADPRNMLLAELYIAEQQARKGGKRKTYDTHMFEVNLHENLARLRDALWNYTYKPSRGTAHIIFHPVQREIFAAPYPDRVVQHWVVDNIDPWWDHRLIDDSYSCRVGKGTLYGINDRVMDGLNRQFANYDNKRYKILRHAIREIIFDDPVQGVKIQGLLDDWRDLPEDKSLFCQPPGQGMVIGNLTSQDFSNIYMDMLDRFVTITLGYKHYGRYVDDFYIVVTEDELPQAKRDIKAIGTFLNGMN